jgi:hypothetical protein
MPSSISSSELILTEQSRPVSGPPQRGLERSVPAAPWLRMLALAASATLVLTLAWEIGMRNLGLRAGDIDDGPSYWTVERRKVDAGPRDSVVIIGDSRILLDTDLETWQKLTGRRPIQLALMGTNAQPVLHDLAADRHFAGLVVIGTAEFSYFSDDAGSMPVVLSYIKTESPSQRVGNRIYTALSRELAFLDSSYTMFNLIEQRQWPERKDVEGPYMDVWKISESYDGRQSYLWDRIGQDEYLRKHAQIVWKDVFAGPPVTADQVARVSASTKSDIDRIRARGGEVVWVRPPSSGPILDVEKSRYPRQLVWDRLVHDSGSFGLYFEDYPAMQHLDSPDWSHLSKASAIAFTEAYVDVLRQRVEWLRVRDKDTGSGKLASGNRFPNR